MSRRAAYSQAEINRALKAALTYGYVVELVDGIIRFLPMKPSEAVAGSEDSETAWDKALGLQ